ncbi:hypothetical protein [Tenacibaculum ovolyticum]|uniref:hypothetical protein n=1 Tax=Tenacibaculum ovolyticum TaxID=104270 RepID=UPI001F233F85|nr:hypothetical protein [Tenacibaculum ovolyticum]
MKQKKEKRISNYDTTGELGFDEMLGAIFYMLLGALKRKYEYYHQIEFQRKNIITGYLLKVFFVFGSIALLYFLFS